MVAPALNAETRATLDRLCSSVVQRQQYLDFVTNREFRASLLCHKEVSPNRTIQRDVLGRLHLSYLPGLERLRARSGKAKAWPSQQGSLLPEETGPQQIATNSYLALFFIKQLHGPRKS
jgi:hypothetical protein